MKTIWTQGLNDQDKETMEKRFKSNTILMSRLRNIIEGLDKEAETKSLSTSTFDKPNWANAQAYLVGQRSTYKQILSLLDQGK